MESSLTSTFTEFVRSELQSGKSPLTVSALGLFAVLIDGPGCKPNKDALDDRRVFPGLLTEIQTIKDQLKDDRERCTYEQRRNASHEIIKKINDQIKDANNDLKVAEYVLEVCQRCIGTTDKPFDHRSSGKAPNDTSLSWFKDRFPCFDCIMFEATIKAKDVSTTVNDVLAKPYWAERNLVTNRSLGENSYNASMTAIAHHLSGELDAAGASERIFHVAFLGDDGDKSSPMDSLVVVGNKSLIEEDVLSYDIQKSHNALATVVEFKRGPTFMAKNAKPRSDALAQGLAYATRLLSHVHGQPKQTSSESFRQLRVVAVNFVTADTGGQQEPRMRYEVVTSIVHMDDASKWIAYDLEPRELS